MKRKICVITGTRADYGILQPVMQAIKDSNKLQLQVVATGMHLMKEFGYTIKEIKFRISAKVNISYQEDSNLAMADSLGRAVSRLAKAFSQLKPAVVIVMGDRAEMFAAAIAANYLNIPVAHIHGGELSGHIDGVVRHAITKLAHIHFPATDNSKKRILALGEEPWRVQTVGAPALDTILNQQLPDRLTLYRKYGLTSTEPFILMAQHSVTGEEHIAGQQIAKTLRAIKRLKIRAIIIYPNADAGGRAMIKEIKKFDYLSTVKSFVSLPNKDYLGLMKLATVQIGNSSSGLIEAPSFGLPVVNIGRRQMGRERGVNVIDVDNDQQKILAALRKAIGNRKFRQKVKLTKNHYGDGQASQRIVACLAKIKINDDLLNKQMTY